MVSVATGLKLLRERAVPRLSMRRMAEALAMPANSYAHYEDADLFKKPFLPMDFARRVASILTEHGIDAAEVMALAGAGDGAGPSLSASEERLVDSFRQLDARQRAILLDLAEALGSAGEGASKKPRPSAPVEAPDRQAA